MPPDFPIIDINTVGLGLLLVISLFLYSLYQRGFPGGGTHVANTSEVGTIKVADYKSKGKINKRIWLEIQ